MENKILPQFQANIGKPMGKTSPAGSWLEGTLVGAEEGQLVAKYEVKKEFTNPMGVLHGGVFGLIMDDLMGALVFSLDNEFAFTTINLSVDYLSAAKIGETIIAKATLVRKGQNVINCECNVTNEAGKLLAKSNSNLGKTHIKLR